MPTVSVSHVVPRGSSTANVARVLRRARWWCEKRGARVLGECRYETLMALRC